jgi:succinate dehydrogenase / fumarate reductase membrane anchor subunit
MSARSPNLRDPLARARGLGSARSGSHHWWVQRVTSVALLLLAPWLAWIVLHLLRADLATVRATFAHPLHATLAVAFVVSMFWHVKLGLQVVIEDYVHGWLEIASQLAVSFACTLGAVASLVAIGRIAFMA